MASPAAHATVPVRALGTVYLFFFGVLGALVPYWGSYLAARGFGPEAIGVLVALLMLTKVVAPPLWGTLADLSGRPMLVLRAGALLALAAFALVPATPAAFWPMVVVVTLYSAFWNAILPLIEATTLNHLQGNTARYGRIRLWGSVGFILAAVSVGWALDRLPNETLPWFALVLFTGLALSTWTLPNAPVRPAAQASPEGLWRRLARPEVLALLWVCLLLQGSHGPYYGFFTIYLGGLGYSKMVIGGLWALGVLAEIGVFVLAARLLPRYRAVPLLHLTLWLTALRWVLLGGFADQWLVVMLAQLLHAASYGLYHAAAIALVDRLFPGRLQTRGLALYSMVGFGLGGALGGWLSGLSWAAVAGPTTFLLAGLAAALAWPGIAVLQRVRSTRECR